MNTAPGLLALGQRTEILDAGPDDQRQGRWRVSRDECEHERMNRRQTARERGDQASPPVGGAPTLDDLLTGIWETIASDRTATCPVCGGVLEPRPGAGAAPVGARCTTCASELS